MQEVLTTCINYIENITLKIDINPPIVIMITLGFRLSHPLIRLTAPLVEAWFRFELLSSCLQEVYQPAFEPFFYCSSATMPFAKWT